MQHFIAIVHKEPDHAFGLTFPDLPGCFAAADEWSGVPAAATEALDLWFEDAPSVEALPLDVIVAREDVAREIAQGATLITISYIPADGKLERVNVSLDRGLLRAIDETADKRGMTRSGFLSSLARREIAGF